MKSTLQNILLAFGLAALGGATVHAQGNGNPNPGILPPTSRLQRQDRRGMVRRLVAMGARQPKDRSNVDDATGEFAHVNNNGADGVFFLAKTWAGVPEVRHIEIPSGTPLYVPLMGWGLLADPGEFLGTYGSVESLFENLFYPDILGVHDLSLEIDGVFVAALEDGNLHYLNFVEDGDDLIVPIWMADGTERETAGYEFSVIVTPLPPGEHVVQLKGQWSDEFDSFESDVTYHLTVLPGPTPTSPPSRRALSFRAQRRWTAPADPAAARIDGAFTSFRNSIRSLDSAMGAKAAWRFASPESIEVGVSWSRQ
jgi:hypothetical protein